MGRSYVADMKPSIDTLSSPLIDHCIDTEHRIQTSNEIRVPRVRRKLESWSRGHFIHIPVGASCGLSRASPRQAHEHPSSASFSQGLLIQGKSLGKAGISAAQWLAGKTGRAGWILLTTACVTLLPLYFEVGSIRARGAGRDSFQTVLPRWVALKHPENRLTDTSRKRGMKQQHAQCRT